MVDDLNMRIVCGLLFESATQRVDVFIAHGAWQPDNRIVRYRGTGSLLAAEWSDQVGTQKDEGCIRSEAGIRYCGVWELRAGSEESFPRIGRSSEAVAGLVGLSRGDRSVSAGELYAALCGGQSDATSTDIDWQRGSRYVCSKDAALLRVYRWLSDPELEMSVEVFVPRSRLSGLRDKVIRRFPEVQIIE